MAINNITEMRDGEYRLLVLAVDAARGVYAISDAEYLKELTKSSVITSASAMDDLIQAQRALEKHVNEYGLPKLGQRV